MDIRAFATRAAPDARSQTASRVEWVDYAKGICIILVVMMHAVNGIAIRLDTIAATDTGFMGRLVAFAAPFRMPDFFLLSGIFLSLTIDKPWLRFFDRKVVHFAYFYVLWLTIQYAFKGPAIALDEDWQAGLAAFLEGFFIPFGTLWFIYMLPIFFLVSRALHKLGVPHFVVLLVAASLQIAPVHTGHLIVDEFSSRYIWFYAGYALAPRIFAVADWVGAHKPAALAGLGTWAFVNGAIVRWGADALPIVSLVLGGLGAMAVVTVGSLLQDLRLAHPLRWIGAHSIVVYLAFFLPMIISREVLMRAAARFEWALQDASIIAAIVTTAGVVGPVILYALVQRTGWGRFLFERPCWAQLEPTADCRPVARRSALV